MSCVKELFDRVAACRSGKLGDELETQRQNGQQNESDRASASGLHSWSSSTQCGGVLEILRGHHLVGGSAQALVPASGQTGQLRDFQSTAAPIMKRITAPI